MVFHLLGRRSRGNLGEGIEKGSGEVLEWVLESLQ